MKKRITEIQFKVINYYVMEFEDMDDEIAPLKIIKDNFIEGIIKPIDSEIEIENDGVRYYD